MSAQEPAEAKEFISSFKGFMDKVVSQTPGQDPVFVRHLRTHFATDPVNLPIISEHFEKSEHPNLHIALTELLEHANRSFTLLGVVAQNEFLGVKISLLLGGQHGMQVTEGPVEYVNIPLQDDQVLACVHSGLYLVRDGDRPLAVLVRGTREMGPRTGIDVEVMSLEREQAEAFLSELRTSMRAHNVYRSHVVSLAPTGDFGTTQVRFHRLPTVRREDIVLPSSVLERIERETLLFSKLRDRLRAAQRHIKRGLLLYGKPGTGKTLTAMYLARQMPEHTVILLNGLHTVMGNRGSSILEQSCRMARLLQPSMVILEDVDLVAEERPEQGTGRSCNMLLFELLNQMDGIAEDADILFVLTTNRPDILEPALATRPGRVDMAIEVPLPDRECRERLFELYGRGLDLRLERWAHFIDQTEGVSAAFIRELLRKAALFAADERQDFAVEDRHLETALKELVLEGGEMTRQLLGANKTS